MVICTNNNPDRRLVIPLLVAYSGGATADDNTLVPASVNIDTHPHNWCTRFSVWAIDDLHADPGESPTISFRTLPAAVTLANWEPERTHTIHFTDND